MRGDADFHRLVCAVGWCVRCGSTRDLEAAHIYPKGRFPEIRFEPLNALCLCRQCHVWGHTRPAEWRQWLRDKYPDRLVELEERTGVGLKD